MQANCSHEDFFFFLYADFSILPSLHCDWHDRWLCVTGFMHTNMVVRDPIWVPLLPRILPLQTIPLSPPTHPQHPSPQCYLLHIRAVAPMRFMHYQSVSHPYTSELQTFLIPLYLPRITLHTSLLDPTFIHRAVF